MSNALPGLSGYDFTSIVNMMVTSYRQPQTAMKTQQTALTAKQTAWQDMKTRLSALEKTLDALRTTSTWTATKATSSNESLLTVKGGTSGITGEYSIKISQLAQAQTAVTKVISVADTKSEINGLTPGDQSFKINGKEVNIKATNGTVSLEDIQNGINQVSAETGVKASVVKVGEGEYRLSLTSTKTGTANEPKFSDASLMENLGVEFTAEGKVKAYTDTTDPAKGGVTVKAADAQLTVNGLNITSSSNVITTAIEGITLNLKDADPSKTIKVTVEEDYSVAQKAIQAFVDQYNGVMSSIANYANYNKTTEKGGTLYADPTLRSIESRLRSMTGGTWENAGGGYKILSEIGISTSSDNFGKDATLTFDTEKFKKAMDNNLQSVANLFGASYNGVTPNEKTSEGGVQRAQGLANIFEEYLKPMVKFQGSLDQTKDSYARQINDVKKRLDDFEDRALAYEERIRLQFARLESTLSALAEQSSWLSAQLSSMNSTKSK